LRIGGGLIAWLIAAFVCVGIAPASAVEAIVLNNQISRIDFAPDHYRTETDRLQVSTAPGADGIVRRIEVRALNPQGPSNWLVFALTNNTQDAAEWSLVIPHSAKSRVVTLTPSQAMRSQVERTKSADIALWKVSAYRKQDPSYEGSK
jgi:hypothetical protein